MHTIDKLLADLINIQQEIDNVYLLGERGGLCDDRDQSEYCLEHLIRILEEAKHDKRNEYSV